MSTVRLRRLQSDSDRLHEYVRRHPRVRLVQKEGDPPERYQLEYRIKSLRMVGGELQPVQSHLVEVALPLNYPRTPPQCRMLSPVFHPNIAPHAICVGDHWGAGESLESIVIRIGEMLAYQSYNVKSPLNGEAARWVEENKDQLPLDPVSLLPEDDQHADGTKPAATALPAAAPPAIKQPPINPPEIKAAVVKQPETKPPDPRQPEARQPTPSSSGGTTPAQSQQLRIRCPECSAQYHVAAATQGRKVRCMKCSHIFTCQADGAK